MPRARHRKQLAIRPHRLHPGAHGARLIEGHNRIRRTMNQQKRRHPRKHFLDRRKLRQPRHQQSFDRRTPQLVPDLVRNQIRILHQRQPGLSERKARPRPSPKSRPFSAAIAARCPPADSPTSAMRSGSITVFLRMFLHEPNRRLHIVRPRRRSEEGRPAAGSRWKTRQSPRPQAA